MKRVRKVGAALLAACLAAGMAAPSWAERQKTTERPSPAAPETVDSVTLITGDRVIVRRGAKTQVSVRPGQGREKVDFQIAQSEGEIQVVPSDAARLLAAKVLDPQLFDVTKLIEDRYDDEHSDELSVIVTHPRGLRAAGTTTLEAAGGEVVRDLAAVSGSAVEVSKDSAETFWNRLVRGDKRALRSGFTKVWLDARIEPTLDQSVPQIGAPAAWEAGYTGTGVRVAVLDGGVDVTHPDLTGKVVGQASFVEGEGTEDDLGHGTHVASTIAGTAAASAGKYKGVASGAELLNGKVCGEFDCPWSSIIAGMQWAVDQQARIVNLSLGGGDSEELDPLEEAVNTLTEQSGTLFVIAAGNAGEYGPGTVNSPGSADAALTVGAVDKQDALAATSSRGPRVGDNAIKPDLTAPGVDIVAARADGSSIGEPVDENYLRLSGTSMAAPHVAGAAALLAQQHPDWKAPQLKAALMASTKPHPTLSVFEQGSGRVDVARAITQSVLAEPASLSYGVQRWPHEDDEPVTKDLTYRNTGSDDVRLTLDGTLTGPDGKPAPSSSLVLSANQVTVPAGGTASVSVTVSTRNDGPVGSYSGAIVASGSGQTVRTVLAVEKESEHYDLTVRHLRRDGQPAEYALGHGVGIDIGLVGFYMTSTDGLLEVRLPAGRYSFATEMFEEVDKILMVAPNVVVDRDREVVFDARTAKPIKVTVPNPSARPVMVGTTHVTRNVFGGGLSLTGQKYSFDNQYYGQSGPNANEGEFAASVYAFLADPGPRGTFENSPYVYGLHFPQPAGAFLTGFDKNVQHRELAEVTSSLRSDLDGRAVFDPMFSPESDQMNLLSANDGLVYDLPGRVVQYLSVDQTLWMRWSSPGVPGDRLWDSRSSQRTVDERFRPGRSRDVFNGAPFGPSLGAGPRSSGSRTGGRFVFTVPLYSDSAGHVGGSDVTSTRATLHRNGELVAEDTTYVGYLDAPDQPAAEADYRLAMSSTRGPETSRYASAVDVAWTFRSKAPSGEGWERVPLSVLRFGAETDEQGRVKAGTSNLTVSVHPNPGTTARPKSVWVEASFDDGATWQRLKLTRVSALNWVTHVRPPAGGFVSLRGEAVDVNGSVVEQKVLRAYGVR